MNIDKNKYGKSSSKYVNWLTIWGFVFGCIAFNLYFDNRQTRLDKLDYRTQYKQESHRADSLYKETLRLEQRLQKMETNTVSKLSGNQSATAERLSAAGEL